MPEIWWEVITKKNASSLSIQNITTKYLHNWSFTDGAKLQWVIGIGVYSESIGISKPIQQQSAIQAAVEIIVDKNDRRRKIPILSIGIGF